jgi:hypothetical protein
MRMCPPFGAGGVVQLPAGRGFHVVVYLRRRSSGKTWPLRVDVYSFLRAVKNIEFVYLTYVPYASKYVPVALASARTIRFG